MEKGRKLRCERTGIHTDESVPESPYTWCRAKDFFSVFAKRMSNHMTQNGYVNTSIQKCGVEGFSGCLEQTGVIQEANE